jgi:hypothetical protein
MLDLGLEHLDVHVVAESRVELERVVRACGDSEFFVSLSFLLAC